MCILKILTDLCLIKQNIKAKNTFASFLQCFSSESVLNEHKEDCLMINGKHNVKLEQGFISFKNYSRQIPVPFKIYADFERVLRNVGSDIINNDISCIIQRKNAVNKLIRSILNEYNYYKKVIKKNFNKN